jgi:hypothetical protein
MCWMTWRATAVRLYWEGVILCGGVLMNPRRNPTVSTAMAAAAAEERERARCRPYQPLSALSHAIARRSAPPPSSEPPAPIQIQPAQPSRVMGAWRFAVSDGDSTTDEDDDEDTIENTIEDATTTDEDDEDDDEDDFRQGMRAVSVSGRLTAAAVNSVQNSAKTRVNSPPNNPNQKPPPSLKSSTNRKAPSLKSRQRGYALLVALRFAAILLPGYIHPDEYFQSTEVAAADVLGVATAGPDKRCTGARHVTHHLLYRVMC